MPFGLSATKFSLSVILLFSADSATQKFTIIQCCLFSSKNEEGREVFFCEEKKYCQIMMGWLNSILTYSSIILLISVLISSISDRWDYRVKMFYIYLWFFLSGIPGNFDIYTYDFTKIIYLFLHFQLSFMVCMSEIL